MNIPAVALIAHPVAASYRDMTPDEYAVLKADIDTHGVRVPGWLYEGKILDGRHRHRAALEVGKTCPMQQYSGDDPRGFAASMNEARRHLIAGARALKAAAEVTTTHGGGRKTDQPDQVANLPLDPPPCGLKAAARAHDVSERTVRHAGRVIKDAVPEVVAAVESGELSVSAAAAVAKLSPDAQREAAEAGSAALHAAAKAARPKKQPADGDIDALRAEVIDLRKKNDALSSEANQLLAEKIALENIVNADDRVKAALAEAKKHRDLAEGLQIRINGLITEKNVAVMAVKAMRRKYEGKRG